MKVPQTCSSMALVVLATTMAVASATPIVQLSPVYGPPSGGYQRFQAAPPSAAPAPIPLQPHQYQYHQTVLTPPPPPQAAPAAAPAGWHYQQPQQRAVQQQAYQRAPAAQVRGLQQQGYQQQGYQHQGHHHQQQGYQVRTQHPQPYVQPAQQQQYKAEQQGVWRYNVAVRPPPVREDQVPHQGLGATDSVTMPEPAPYDPLLVTGPAAAHFVRTLSDREPHFFPAFPHTRLVLSNQQKRLDNGLPANRLGSIRSGSDFYRRD